MADRIQLRRDTKANWESYNPILLEGEPGHVLDYPNLYKMGDGVHAWNDLPYRGYDGTMTQNIINDPDSVPSNAAVYAAFNILRSSGYIYIGIATPTLNPGTPTEKVFYIAMSAGTYTNFGGLVVSEGITILKYNGSAWSQELILQPATINQTGLMSAADKQAVDNIQDNPQFAYVVCDTAASTAAKVISLTGYILPANGGSIKIKMTNANTANNVTLQIGSADAKPLYYTGQRAGSANSWEAGEVIEVYYDGTNYQANNVRSDSIVLSDASYSPNIVLSDGNMNSDGTIEIIRNLKHSNEFWLNAGDYLEFDYTTQYSSVLMRVVETGVSYFTEISQNNVSTEKHIGFYANVDGYYIFNVNTISNVIIHPIKSIEKTARVAESIRQLNKDIEELRRDTKIDKIPLIVSIQNSGDRVGRDSGACWNVDTEQLVSSAIGSSVLLRFGLNGAKEIDVKYITWSTSYVPTFFSSDEVFDSTTLIENQITEKRLEYLIPVPPNAKTVCIMVKNSIASSDNCYIKRIYPASPTLKTSKTWASIGDSITRINDDKYSDYTNTLIIKKGYQDLVREKITFGGFTNLGVSGATSVSYPYEDIVSADIYTIALGINDWGAGTVLGTLDDYANWQSGDSVNNFAQAIARIIGKIRTVNSSADVIIMTPTRTNQHGFYPSTSKMPNSAGVHLYDYADMLIQIADYEGFPIVDLTHHGGITDATLGIYTYDNTHPNNNGCKLIANHLYPVIRKYVYDYIDYSS